MTSLRTLLFVLALSSAGVVSSCSSPSGPPSPNDNQAESAALADIADNVLVPMYVAFNASATALETDLHAFATQPNEQLLSVCRADWRATRHSWQRCYTCAIGDLSTDNIVTLIDPRPIDYARIDALLTSSDPIDLNSARSWEDDLRGLRPMEYVLFGTTGLRAAASFTPRELAYLAVLAQDIHVLSAKAARSWDASQPTSYYANFVQAGTASSAYPTARAALIDIARAIDAMCEDVVTNEINTPLSDGVAYDPSPWADDAVAGFAEELESAREIYEGTSPASKGLSAVVVGKDANLDASIRTALQTARDAVQSIPTPYRTSIEQHDARVTSASQAIESLHTTLSERLIPILYKEAQ